ncbi:MAG: hypothetical protein H6Q14_2901 [Bacteroidetes bacterium]|nr:hypothetical protein [Bacteroidota bacterium]
MQFFFVNSLREIVSFHAKNTKVFRRERESFCEIDSQNVFSWREIKFKNKDELKKNLYLCNSIWFVQAFLQG